MRIEAHRVTVEESRPWGRGGLCLVLLFCAALAMAGSARAAIQLDSFEFASTDASGQPSQLAGAHPFQVTASFVFASHDEGNDTLPNESPRNVTVDLPPGLIGIPTATPTCSEGDAEVGTCPLDTQIGYIELTSPSHAEDPVLSYPMFNMKPVGVAAQFGIVVFQVPTRVVGEIHAERGYGISVRVRNLHQALSWTQLKVTIWGVPADASHDGLRGDCLLLNGESSGASCPADAARLPLLTNPSACLPVLSVVARIDSWENPGVFTSATAANRDSLGNPVGITDCESLDFNPTISAAPSASTPRAPTGMTVALHAPQVADPDGRAEATVGKATVILPEGVAISPSAAAGLGACAEDQIRLGNDSPPTCPDDSKLGTLTVDTPLLDEPLSGPIYLARPWETPFESRFAVYAVAVGRGVLVKLAGRVDPDPATGQLRVTFDRIPQLPFRDLEVDFWGGPRALLSNPPHCGAYATTSKLTAWGAAAPVERSASFELSSGCPEPRFRPVLSAGSRDPRAGAFSTFALRLRRGDLDGEFASLSSIELPPGLAVALKGMSYCPDSVLVAAEASESTPLGCPDSSRVGSVVVGAGPGPSPIYLSPGDVYLAGPYGGAPLSLAISIPALAGPFDLGTVKLRAALRVDPIDLHAEIVAGRLPAVLAGIPLQIRDLRLEIDRPRFILNPSNCGASSVTVSAVSNERMTAEPSSPFRVAGCRRLGFAPKLTVGFSDAPTRRGGHPRVRAILSTRRGDANIARAALTMPPTEFLDTTHIRSVCSRERYAADRCPKGSIYGYAKVSSPLLDQPLRGPVYLRSSAHTLPDLVASLDGQIHVDLAGRIDSPGGRIRSVFRAVPDVPVSRFVLNMHGGRRGLLVNNTELCGANPRAWAKFAGQNAKRSVSGSLVKIDCERRRK